MAGLFDRPPPPRGLFEGILAGMGRGLTNPGGFFVNEGAPAAQALGSMVLSPFVQANQAMPWGGNDPSAIGIDPQTGSIDPSVMVPWATDVAGTVTAGAGLAPPVMGGAGMGIRAYHASPHDFDRFEISPRTSHTGEGAQAYGPGGYFAESEKVSGRGGTYDQALSSQFKGYEFQGKSLKDVETTGNPVADVIVQRMNQMKRPDIVNATDAAFYDLRDAGQGVSWPEMYDARRFLEKNLEAKRSGQAHIYEVDIDASPDEFLDWDKPLADQGEVGFQAVENLRSQFQSIASMRGNPSGQEIYNRLEAIRGADGAAKILRDAGIKGIRYKDAGSRGAMLRGQERIDQIAGEVAYLEGKIAKHSELYSDSPDVVQKWHDRLATAKSDLEKAKSGADLTNNYVVFSDDIISILKKYGLAGLTAGGAGAAMLGSGTDQAQAAQPPWMTGGRF